MAADKKIDDLRPPELPDYLVKRLDEVREALDKKLPPNLRHKETNKEDE